MTHPFGFILDKKKQPHIRTLPASDTFHYVAAFYPYFVKDKIKQVRKFKSMIDTAKSKKAVEMAFDYLDTLIDVRKHIDAILAIPSQSKVMPLIIKVAQRRYGLTVYMVLRKNKMNELVLSDAVYDDKNWKYIVNYMSGKRNDASEAQVHRLSSKIRKYLRNEIALTSHPKRLWGKRVLLIDDTIGEGSTFCNAIHALAPLNLSSVLCFAVLRDFIMGTASRIPKWAYEVRKAA